MDIDDGDGSNACQGKEDTDEIQNVVRLLSLGRYSQSELRPSGGREGASATRPVQPSNSCMSSSPFINDG